MVWGKAFGLGLAGVSLALAACSEEEAFQRKNTADQNAKLTEERRVSMNKGYFETPECVPVSYRRLQSDEIEDLLEASKLEAYEKSRYYFIEKRGNTYVQFSVGNRSNGGITPARNLVIKNDALMPENPVDSGSMIFSKEAVNDGNQAMLNEISLLHYETHNQCDFINFAVINVQKAG